MNAVAVASLGNSHYLAKRREALGNLTQAVHVQRVHAALVDRVIPDLLR